jgi:hypothetical protein
MRRSLKKCRLSWRPQATAEALVEQRAIAAQALVL